MAFTISQNRKLGIDYIDSLITRSELYNALSIEGVFYEIEAAVVVDIILNKDHPKLKEYTVTDDINSYPIKYDGNLHSKNDITYSQIGSILFRFLNSDKQKERSLLSWALPLENNISEYPLLNEVVLIYKIVSGKEDDGIYRYSKKVCLKNYTNTNANFLYEPSKGKEGRLTSGKNTKIIGNEGDGVLGKYFIFNHKIRPISRYEGDMVFESRFGSSIRFGAYEDDDKTDNGTGEYSDGFGNPKILIRNRQRKLNSKSEENIYGYNIPEDINEDGTSIQITSGKTISEFNWNTSKVFFQNSKKEEQPAYSPTDSTNYTFPSKTKHQEEDIKYFNGNQFILNTDRVIIQSRNNETFHFSKRRYSVITDDEYTIDAHKQIVFTTNTKTVLNSPFIYLGQYDETREPAVLGQTLVEFLYDMCDWLSAHVHPHPHSHPNSGGRGSDSINYPINTSHPSSQFTSGGSKSFKIEDLKKRLTDILSRRVFITGGGYAPGSDGGELNKSTSISNKMPLVDIPGKFMGTSRGSGLHIKNWSTNENLDKYDIYTSNRNKNDGETVSKDIQ